MNKLIAKCANIPMNVFYNIHALMVQLGTSCVFGSPGLARNEPTLGKRSHGDSTPTALFPTQHTLTQGSLHYRLATLGYQKRNTYGVETCIL